MEEIHRVAAQGARVIIKVPHFSSHDAFTDITHKHFFSSRSMDYFILGTKLYKFGYAGIKFKKTRIHFEKSSWKEPLRSFIAMLLNHLPPFLILVYESQFAFLLPIHQIVFELTVIKIDN